MFPFLMRCEMVPRNSRFTCRMPTALVVDIVHVGVVPCCGGCRPHALAMRPPSPEEAALMAAREVLGS